MNSRNSPILVLGGTGHYGTYIVKNLLSKGQTVRVFTRNAEKARNIVGNEVEFVEGDITSESSLRKTVEGTKAIIITLSAFTSKLIRKLYLIEHDCILNVFEIAKEQGVSRIVYISSYETREEIITKYNLEIGRIKQNIETALAKSNFNWTVLGSPPSMKIFFVMLRGNTMMVPGGGPPALPTVSPVDVGEIVSQTVMRENLSNKRFRMTSPDALSFQEAAKRISVITGKEIKIRKIPLLPFKIASIITRPFNPFPRYLLQSVKLLNNFPQDIVNQVSEDHNLLIDTFQYAPTTLEMEIRRRMNI